MRRRLCKIFETQLVFYLEFGLLSNYDYILMIIIIINVREPVSTINFEIVECVEFAKVG